MAQDNNPYDAVIADVETKITMLTALRDTLKQVREMDMSLSAIMTGTSNVTATATAFRHDSFFGMTIPDAAKAYLMATKKTASVGELADALPKYGLKTASKNFSETVRAILSRSTEFVKINSEFGLAEWYPGRAARRPRKADDQQEETPDANPDVVGAILESKGV